MFFADLISWFMAVFGGYCSQLVGPPPHEDRIRQPEVYFGTLGEREHPPRDLSSIPAEGTSNQVGPDGFFPFTRAGGSQHINFFGARHVLHIPSDQAAMLQPQVRVDVSGILRGAIV